MMFVHMIKKSVRLIAMCALSLTVADAWGQGVGIVYPTLNDPAVQAVYWDMTDPGVSPPWSTKNCQDGQTLMLNDLNRMRAEGKHPDFFANFDYGPVRIDGLAGHLGIVIYPKFNKDGVRYASYKDGVKDGVVLEYTNYVSSYFGFYDTRTWYEWENNWSGNGFIDPDNNYWNEDGPQYPIPKDLSPIEPHPELKADASHRIFIGNSSDPNEKVGPSGAGDARYIMAGGLLSYSVYFENAEDATADAQRVIVVDFIDIEHLDPSTFAFGPITFGDRRIEPPPASQEFEEILDLRPEKNMLLRVVAHFTPESGEARWELTAIDPETWSLPDFDGFLPPNRTPPEGDGTVSYIVSLRAEVESNMPVGEGKLASIIFDSNPAIETGDWTNTLDGDAPVSAVSVLESQPTAAFPVSWTGTDDASGIADYTVYVAEGEGSFRPWLVRTSAESAQFAGKAGSSYTFYCLARDAAGNEEDTPSRIVSTAVLDSDGDGVADGEDNCPAVANPDQADQDGDGIGDVCEPVPGDLDGDRDVDKNDVNKLLTYRNKPASACPECDLDGDGKITVLDARRLALMCTRASCATQ